MKALVVFCCLFIGSFSFAQSQSVNTIETLRTILPLDQSMTILNGSVVAGLNKTCQLIISRRDFMLNSSQVDKTIDLGLLIDGQIKLSLHLKAKLKPSAKAYESEFDYKLISSKQIEIFSSIGHMTDQYHGYNGYTLNLNRQSETSLQVQLEHSWADDDGMSGGSTNKCQFSL